MEQRGDGDGVQGPELESKSRKEEMMDKVEELKTGEAKAENGLEVVQPDGTEPQGDGPRSEESQREKPRSGESEKRNLSCEGSRVESPTSEEQKENDAADDESQEEKPKGDGSIRNDAINDGLGGGKAHDDQPPMDGQSASDTEAPPESQQSSPVSQQSTLADSEQDRRRLEHCSPEVVEEPPVEEKKLGQLESPQHAFAETADDLPSHCRQHRHNGLFWSPPSPLLEPVPPQYSGGATDYPEVVDAPLELEASVESSEELICGLRKRQFLLMFGIMVLVVVVVAVSVGVGVAYGTRKTTAAPASTGLTPWPLKPCDAIHNTKFTTENGKVFQRLCFLDYGGSTAEATDLEGVRTESMEECMKACSEREDCTGAGWGPPNGVNQYRGTCWMKKDLKRPHVATADFEFAVLVSGNVTIPDMEPYF